MFCAEKIVDIVIIYFHFISLFFTEFHLYAKYLSIESFRQSIPYSIKYKKIRHLPLNNSCIQLFISELLKIAANFLVGIFFMSFFYWWNVINQNNKTFKIQT